MCAKADASPLIQKIEVRSSPVSAMALDLPPFLARSFAERRSVGHNRPHRRFAANDATRSVRIGMTTGLALDGWGSAVF